MKCFKHTRREAIGICTICGKGLCTECAKVADEKIICELIERTLERNNYDVEIARNGKTALEKVKESVFDILITDVKMPKISGMDVLKEIKKANPIIEVIVITGYPTIELAVEAIKIGAYDFITKPFDINKVQSMVNKCLKKQRLNKRAIQLGELKAFFEATDAVTATSSHITDVLKQAIKKLDKTSESNNTE